MALSVSKDRCPHKTILKTTVTPEGSVFGKCARCGEEDFVIREVTPPNPAIIRDGQVWVGDSVPECLVVLSVGCGVTVHFFDDRVVEITPEEVRGGRKLLEVATSISDPDYEAM